MANTILLKKSGVANAVPLVGDLALGELAINYIDGNIFYKTAAGTVTVIASNKFLTVTGNVTGGNILTGGLISAAGNITGANINFGSGSVSGTGNVYASNFIGNISGNIDAAGSNTWVQFNDTGDILGATAGFTFTKTTNAVVVTGNVPVVIC